MSNLYTSRPHRRDSPSPLLNFNDSSPNDQQMLFGDVDMDDRPTFHQKPNPSSVPFPWLDDTDLSHTQTYDLPDPSASLNMYDFSSSPTDSSGYLSSGLFTPEDSNPLSTFDNEIYSPNWNLSSPIPVPSSPTDSVPSSFHAYHPPSYMATGAFSPSDFAALHALPASASPSSSFGDNMAFEPQAFGSPPDASYVSPPNWANELFESQQPARHVRTSSSPTNRHSPLGDRSQRPPLLIPARRGSLSAGNIFQSASAPSHQSAFPAMSSRSYSASRRGDSPSVKDDPEGTVRRRRKASYTNSPSPPPQIAPATASAAPLKPVLKPPKLAPSAWQLYFTDWIQRQQASGARKLNVAQAAKEAGQEYASLSAEEKEPYKRRSQELKEIRERDLDAYMRSLTPEDYKRENAYRTAQRKAGKSRKSNVKDPNAPKKPLSAYFMFLQRIRSDPAMVRDVFGDESETTKQSVLAAAKWRSMTDEERQPFLAQAEHEKMEYEAARRLYEEGNSGYGGTTINFSILPSSPPFQTVKVEQDADMAVTAPASTHSDLEDAAGNEEWKKYIRC